MGWVKHTFAVLSVNSLTCPQWIEGLFSSLKETVKTDLRELHMLVMLVKKNIFPPEHATHRISACVWMVQLLVWSIPHAMWI